jgi:adenylate cyclase
MSDVFISYAREEHDVVARLAHALEAGGFSVWWDRDLVGGEEFGAAIERELAAAAAVVVCWSSAGSRSRWVRDEASIAADAGKIISVSLDGSVPPIGFRQYHCVNLQACTRQRPAELPEHLLRAVHARLQGGGAPERPPGVIRRQPERDQVATQKSIAVLPFADMSPARDNEYFSDGLCEELLSVLTTVPNLRVSSRTSCFAFKGKDVDIPTVAERLRVSHVVEGSVRKSGELIRITAQLIEADTDAHLWSKTWDRSLGDIFAIQDEIARSIVEALALTLNPGDVPDATTRDPRAYDHYLKGLSFYHRFGPKSQGFAIEMFGRATALDPGFAKAWAGSAGAYSVLAVYHGGGEAALAAADEASRKAIDLAPAMAEAYAARAVYFSAGERFDEAARAFERAIALNPGLFEAWYQYARTVLHQGRYRRALELFERAAEVNPDDYQSPLIAAPVYRSLGQEDKALEAERRGVALAERHLEDYPDNARAYFLATSALWNLGRKKEAVAWNERAIAIDPWDPVTRYNSACFYAQVGEIDKAFDFLENTVTSRSWAENDPDLEPLRADPRFKALMERL